MTEKLDVLVVGAGISGIGAGYHLQNKCPDAKFVILEGRDKTLQCRSTRSTSRKYVRGLL